MKAAPLLRLLLASAALLGPGAQARRLMQQQQQPGNASAAAVTVSPIDVPVVSASSPLVKGGYSMYSNLKDLKAKGAKEKKDRLYAIYNPDSPGKLHWRPPNATRFVIISGPRAGGRFAAEAAPSLGLLPGVYVAPDAPLARDSLVKHVNAIYAHPIFDTPTESWYATKANTGSEPPTAHPWVGRERNEGLDRTVYRNWPAYEGILTRALEQAEATYERCRAATQTAVRHVLLDLARAQEEAADEAAAPHLFRVYLGHHTNNTFRIRGVHTERSDPSGSGDPLQQWISEHNASATNGSEITNAPSVQQQHPPLPPRSPAESADADALLADDPACTNALNGGALLDYRSSLARARAVRDALAAQTTKRYDALPLPLPMPSLRAVGVRIEYADMFDGVNGPARFARWCAENKVSVLHLIRINSIERMVAEDTARATGVTDLYTTDYARFNITRSAPSWELAAAVQAVEYAARHARIQQTIAQGTPALDSQAWATGHAVEQALARLSALKDASEAAFAVSRWGGAGNIPTNPSDWNASAPTRLAESSDMFSVRYKSEYVIAGEIEGALNGDKVPHEMVWFETLQSHPYLDENHDILKAQAAMLGIFDMKAWGDYEKQVEFDMAASHALEPEDYDDEDSFLAPSMQKVEARVAHPPAGKPHLHYASAHLASSHAAYALRQLGDEITSRFFNGSTPAIMEVLSLGYGVPAARYSRYRRGGGGPVRERISDPTIRCTNRAEGSFDDDTKPILLEWDADSSTLDCCMYNNTITGGLLAGLEYELRRGMEKSRYSRRSQDSDLLRAQMLDAPLVSPEQYIRERVGEQGGDAEGADVGADADADVMAVQVLEGAPRAKIAEANDFSVAGDDLDWTALLAKANAV